MGDKSAVICQGAVVDCDFNTEGGYFTGKVGVVNMDGTFDIEYDDGDKEAAVRVHRGRIRLPFETRVVFDDLRLLLCVRGESAEIESPN